MCKVSWISCWLDLLSQKIAIWPLVVDEFFIRICIKRLERDSLMFCPRSIFTRARFRSNKASNLLIKRVCIKEWNWIPSFQIYPMHTMGYFLAHTRALLFGFECTKKVIACMVQILFCLVSFLSSHHYLVISLFFRYLIKAIQCELKI